MTSMKYITLIFFVVLQGCASTPNTDWVNTNTADLRSSELLFKIDHGECTGLMHSLIGKSSGCNAEPTATAPAKKSASFIDWFNIPDLFSRWKARQQDERLTAIEEAQKDVYTACMAKRGWLQQSAK